MVKDIKEELEKGKRYHAASKEEKKILANKLFKEDNKPIDSSSKDFIYVEDFVAILLKLINMPFKFMILNVASGKSISLKKIIDFLSKIYKRDKKNIKFNFNKPTMIPVRRINIRKLKKLIKFKPKFTLEKGLLDTIKWYKRDN